MKRITPIILFCFMLLNACKPTDKTIPLQINLSYHIDQQEFIADSLLYTNQAGNQYMISEIQWFLSHIELQNSDGQYIEPKIAGYNDNICYIDTDIDSTQHLQAQLENAIGRYTAVRFVFGLNENDNFSNRYVNPPLSFMFWPEMLGGGYHYMKFNGKWLTNEGLKPFNIHLGIGQNAALSEFYQNYFVVELPIDFELKKSSNTLNISMNINNWFSNPNCYDLNYYGGAIMQNQEAMHIICENGKQDVFNISVE